MDYGEEEEEFRGSNGFSGNYDLDIIQENPDDEAEASGPGTFSQADLLAAARREAGVTLDL